MTQKQIAAKSLEEANELLERLEIKEAVEGALETAVIPVSIINGRMTIKEHLRSYIEQTPEKVKDVGRAFVLNYESFEEKELYTSFIVENVKRILAKKLSGLMFLSKNEKFTEVKSILKAHLEDLDGQVIIWDIIEDLFNELDKHVYTEYVRQIEDALAEGDEEIIGVSILYKGERKENEEKFPQIMPMLTVRIISDTE